MPFYPVNLNIYGQLCVVVGGGGVARRKVASLLSCGARVRVISPALVEQLQGLAAENRIEWQARGYEEGDCAGAFLVFAATDQPEIQNRVLEDAGRFAIPINMADNPDQCSFQVPSILRRGDLLLTVSTGGGSPALAAKLRRELEERYGPEYGQLVALMGEVREWVLSQGGNCRDHKSLFESLLEQGLEGILRSGDWALLVEKLTALLPPQAPVRAIVDRLKTSFAHAAAEATGS